jgi:hypothetical protein
MILGFYFIYRVGFFIHLALPYSMVCTWMYIFRDLNSLHLYKHIVSYAMCMNKINWFTIRLCDFVDTWGSKLCYCIKHLIRRTKKIWLISSTAKIPTKVSYAMLFESDRLFQPIELGTSLSAGWFNHESFLV